MSLFFFLTSHISISYLQGYYKTYSHAQQWPITVKIVKLKPSQKMSQYYSFVKRFLDIAWPDKMLSDNNIVTGFTICGFLPCLHIQEKGLKQSCSQFINALGWLPFREWLSSTKCGINCQCWWKSTGCTVDITLANGLGEVGTKLISAGFIL